MGFWAGNFGRPRRSRMIYFDTAYIVKCYLPEAGFDHVRELLNRAETASSCVFGRIEFATAIRRAVREARLPATAIDTVYSILSADDRDGVWNWLPITPALP